MASSPIAELARSRRRRATMSRPVFPGDLPTTERFDVIVFNDVFEHLSEPRMALGHVPSARRKTGY
jgi:2-polyprenyl-3-methyl-5-hydroxy-6-metoxy-1,4-benzoquinol methylase